MLQFVGGFQLFLTDLTKGKQKSRGGAFLVFNRELIASSDEASYKVMSLDLVTKSDQVLSLNTMRPEKRYKILNQTSIHGCRCRYKDQYFFITFTVPSLFGQV